MNKLNFFFSSLKNITSPAYTFLLCKCRNNREMYNYNKYKLFRKKYTSPANEFLLHNRNNREIKN